MVRPTEEEKDLQNVQKLKDNQLRKEFFQQMQQLRQKVFKRVRPKQIHGRVLTGQMFLELCHAYTESINKGSVPSIQSAWTNLCKNENLRAIQDAIQMYEKEMQKHLEKADDYKQMKELHKSLSESVKKKFQSEAFGDGLEECLKKIDQEIGSLFERLKIKMTKNIEVKIKNQIQELTKPIVNKLR